MIAKSLTFVAMLGIGIGLLTAYSNSLRSGPMTLSGTVEAHEVRVGTLISGRVAEVLSAEGDAVRPGQPLAKLETAFVDMEIAAQRGRVSRAQAALALVRAGPRSEERNRAVIEWREAESFRARQWSLLQRSLISEAEYDESAARAEALHEIVKETELGSRKEEIAIAEAALAEESARLGYLETQLEEATIVAPVTGVVQTLRIRPGWLVEAGEPLVLIVETGSLWVTAYVPETELGIVHVGQAAAVRVDTFPDLEFAGRVAHISQRGEYTPRNMQTFEQRSQLMFEVRVDLVPDRRLKPGMAAFVTLQTK